MDSTADDAWFRKSFAVKFEPGSTMPSKWWGMPLHSSSVTLFGDYVKTFEDLNLTGVDNLGGETGGEINGESGLTDVLPSEVMNLTRLRILLLDETKNLKGISRTLISRLPSLQVFSRILSSTTKNLSRNYDQSSSDEELLVVLHYDQSSGNTVLLEGSYDQPWNEVELFEGLVFLKRISDKIIALSSFRSVHHFKSSPKLLCCSKRLTIMCTELVSLNISSSAMRRMENLHTPSISDCYILRAVKICLEEDKERARSTYA
ncbi:hypothetical protein Dsin_013672 [Dipteronia sinensis]|uniref:Uncharacterized protein n=1 Tax=Dipteronia sinensis TaxID=43782 RepID=A0AAE0ALI7_9ROSI|nr:hypothetical protein Dsin_013672 [Dipteronia sinensis]